MRSLRTTVVACATALLAWPLPQAHAEPQSANTSAAATAGAVAASATADPGVSGTSLFGGLAKAVSATTLDGIRGGAEVVVSDMRLRGTVAYNTATDVPSGANSIAGGSFANASGMPTVIQNSGTNVLIQNATIVNVQFK